MRSLAEVIELDYPVSPTLDCVKVTALLRRGRKTILNPPKESLDMECQDCGYIEGYTCRDGEDRCWFCSNEGCIERDSEITKEMAEKARRHKF